MVTKTTDKIKPTYVDFDHDNYKWKSDIDYRKNPHLYHIGRGQQGVLTCEPYKSELHPLWRFKTPEEAQLSALKYLKKISVTILVYHLPNLTNGKFYHMIEQKKDSISLVKYSKLIGR